MQQKKHQKYRNRKSETRPKTWNLANIVKFTSKSNKFTVRFRFLLNNDVINFNYLLDETLNFLDDFFETSTGVGWLGRVHLVDADNQLFDTQGVGQQGVLTGLTVLGDTGLEFTHTGSDNQYTTISLGSTCNFNKNCLNIL